MTQQNLERISFFLLLALVSLAFVGLLRGFMVALFWAVAFAILFQPLANHLQRLLGDRPALISVFTVLIVLLVVVIPLIGLGIAVTGEVGQLVTAVQAGSINFGAPAEWMRENLPDLWALAGNYGFDTNGLRESLSKAALASGQWVASNAVRAGQGTLNFTLSMFLMIYLLFFFLRDGSAIIERLVQVLPLGDERERQLFSRFAQVVRATVKGTFIIGAVQGTIGGVTFALLGIDGAVLWGVLMALLSLLPAVGSVLVWGPAAAILFADGAVVSGAILVAVGVLVIGLADNLLRPILVGRDTRLPDYLVLLATLGGLGTFGISGLVIGPLIAALFITVWEMFEASFGSPVVPVAVQGAAAAALPAEQADAVAEALAGDAVVDAAPAGVDEMPDPGLDDEFSDR